MDADGPQRVPNNLPRAATAFVGREAELALLAQHLADPDCRLVTLVGPGGIGKTRLAVEAATRQLAADAFPGGVFLVRLDGLSDAAFIAPAVADALSLPLQGQQDPALQIRQYLRARTLLLVLDNFEHLLAGIDLLTDLLTECAAVKLLITTREPLDLEEEWILAVGGLPVPSTATVAALEASSAGQLFVHRARRVQATFALTEEDAPAVQRICRMVGGLPLGIELAAAWVKMLSGAEIAQEIERNMDFLNTTRRNIPERHRSVRAVFEYSWQALTDEERRVFRQLAVFRGGFLREAAATVVGANLTTLAALVDKSLLEVTPHRRYERHLLLYQYAQEKLAEAPDEQQTAQERHGGYYARFLRQRAAALHGAHPEAALVEIDAEIENVRAAWRWAVGGGRLAEIDQCVESLESFYDARGWYAEGEETFGLAVSALRAVPDAGQAETQRVLGRVLARQGNFCARQGRLAGAVALLEQSLRILRPLGDRRDPAYALLRLGAVVAQRGEYDQARRHHQESLTLARSAGDRRGVMHALNALGLDASKLGEYGESRRRYEESLALARELDDRSMTGLTLNYLGYMLCLAGAPAEAQPLLAESLALIRELGDEGRIPYVLGSLGQAAYALGDYPGAQQLTEESLERAGRLGDRMLMTYDLLRLGDTACALADYAAADGYYRRALHTAMEIAALPRALAALIGLAQIRAHGSEGAPDPAGALALLAQPLRHPATEQPDRARAQRLRAALTQALGAAEVAALAREPARPLLEVVEELLGVRLPQSLAALLAVPTFEVNVDFTEQAQQVEAITESAFFAELRASAGLLRLELEAEDEES